MTALVDFGIKYKKRERYSTYRPSGREEEAGRCSHRENSRIPLSPFSSEMVLLGFPSAWFGERRAVNTSSLPDWPACLTKKRRRLRILFAPRKNCLDFLFSLLRKLTLEIYFKIPLPSCATSIGRGGEEEEEKTIGPSFPPFLLLSWPCQRASRQRRGDRGRQH